MWVKASVWPFELESQMVRGSMWVQVSLGVRR